MMLILIFDSNYQINLLYLLQPVFVTLGSVPSGQVEQDIIVEFLY